MDENILARIPGHYLARAIQSLPDASTVIDAHMDAIIDVPGIGLVRVTAKRMKHKRGKSIHYFWTPERAVAVSRAE